MRALADERAEAFLRDVICCDEGEDRVVDTAHHRLSTPGWERSAPAGNLLLEAERADSRRWVYRIRRARRAAGCKAGAPNAGAQRGRSRANAVGGAA